MNWDLIVGIANIFLTVGIIPQLIINYKTKNVESHCIFWHLSTLTGVFILIMYFISLSMWIAIIGLCATVIFRFTIIYQIFKYRVKK